MLMKRGLSRRTSRRTGSRRSKPACWPSAAALYDNVGPHGLKYFPVVATFGVLISSRI